MRTVVWVLVCIFQLLLSACGDEMSTMNASASFIAQSGPLSSKFMEQAKDTYARLETCMNTWIYRKMDKTPRFALPVDAEEHFQNLLNLTAQYRKTPMHSYSHYYGPWVENIFISTFLDRPFTYFRGIFPLFIPWTDLAVDKRLLEVNRFLTPHLRSDVLYMAVVQNDGGLENITTYHPNILVLSAGGFGHIPIPLIKGELQPSPPPAHSKYQVSFYGTERPERKSILRSASSAVRTNGLSYESRKTDPQWESRMRNTLFNLAPRGFGLTSFRLYEIIQMGRLPVYLWTDRPWLPYKGTNKSIEQFGFLANLDQLPSLFSQLKQLSLSEEYQPNLLEQLIRSKPNEQETVAEAGNITRHLLSENHLLSQSSLELEDAHRQLQPINHQISSNYYPQRPHHQIVRTSSGVNRQPSRSQIQSTQEHFVTRAETPSQPSTGVQSDPLGNQFRHPLKPQIIHSQSIGRTPSHVPPHLRPSGHSDSAASQRVHQTQSPRPAAPRQPQARREFRQPPESSSVGISNNPKVKQVSAANMLVHQRAAKAAHENIQKRYQHLQAVRHAYTYQGVMEEIDKFFKYPPLDESPESSALRCENDLPPKFVYFV